MTKPVDVKVVRAVPSDIRNDLYHTTDGYDWIFEHTGYTKADVVKPGFFNTYREMMRVGAMIECRLGEIADGLTQVWLQVIAAPKAELAGHVMVSVGPARKFTPVRHEGTMTEDKEEAKIA